MSEGEMEDFLSPPRVAVLATIGRAGFPHLSGMWFVRDGNVYKMWTYGKSQKAVNARRDPRASLLVEDGSAYSELRGISIRGHLTVIDPFDQVRAIGIALFKRYAGGPSGELQEEVVNEIERQARKRVGLELRADRVATWDHGKLS
jgi:PPOX class probable F420-dependent enzyme